MAYNKETEMYEGYIYKIYNDVNDKVYIGQTKRDLDYRWKQHLSKTRHKEDNSIIHKAIEKYGAEFFHVEEIEKVHEHFEDELLKTLNDLEQYYIQIYNSLSPNGYNILIGGNNCPTSHRIHPLYQYNMKGEYINYYPTMTDALKSVGETNLKTGLINHHLKTDACAYGFLWSDDKDVCPLQQYIDYHIKKKDNIKNRRSKKYVISKYDINLNFICYYYSFKDIKEDNKDVAKNSLYTYLIKKNKAKPYKDYYWFYADDPEQPDKTKIIN